MKGRYVGRDEHGKAIYVDVDYRQWVPRQDVSPHFRWPPRTVRRAEPVALRGRTRRSRKAHQRIVRMARRYGFRLTVDGRAV